MTRPNIVVATPCFGGLVTQSFMISVMRLTSNLEKAGLGIDMLMLGGDSLISRARSLLVSHFLARPEATHLLFIDADISFEPEQFHRLLA